MYIHSDALSISKCQRSHKVQTQNLPILMTMRTIKHSPGDASSVYLNLWVCLNCTKKPLLSLNCWESLTSCRRSGRCIFFNLVVTYLLSQLLYVAFHALLHEHMIVTLRRLLYGRQPHRLFVI